MISLVVFFGNYGKEYAATRHNSGWIFAESIPWVDTLSWQQKFKGQFASVDTVRISTTGFAGEPDIQPASALPHKIMFLKPETYMNLSGEAAAEAAKFFKIKPEEILVVHDELELPPGTVSLKWSGGLGGHNGLRSMKTCFGTADFWRLRIGIGRPDHSDIAGYVLSPFTADERSILAQEFVPLETLLRAVLLKGPDAFLKNWSKKNLAR